jgi:rRNA maturation endonuclease Nob1
MPEKEKKKVILDSGAVINDSFFSFQEGLLYLMPESVLSELKDTRSRLLADNAIKNSLLEIKSPSRESLAAAKKATKELNTELSGADTDVLALAIEFNRQKKKTTVLTDDYSLQNVLSYLGIGFTPVLHTGIKRHFTLRRKCANCGATIKGKECERCGHTA